MGTDPAGVTRPAAPADMAGAGACAAVDVTVEATAGVGFAAEVAAAVDEEEEDAATAAEGAGLGTVRGCDIGVSYRIYTEHVHQYRVNRGCYFDI